MIFGVQVGVDRRIDSVIGPEFDALRVAEFGEIVVPRAPFSKSGSLR
jgi:hypothetical protein